MKAPTVYLQPRKALARQLGEAFIAGWGSGELTEDLSALRPGPAVFYGVTPETRPLYEQCVREDREHYYIDNGYFKSRHHGGEYYRVTKNRPQHTGVGASDGARWAALGIPIQPWRVQSDNAHVLVACQSPWWYERHGTSLDEWTQQTVARLRALTQRPIIVRQKADKSPLWPLLEAAYCTVSHSSNVAIDGILRGVPAIVTHACAAVYMGNALCSDFNNLFRPDHEARAKWAAALSDNQWTVEEIARGLCAQKIRET